MLHRRVYPGSPPPPGGDMGSASCFTASIKRTSLLRIRNPLLVVGAPPVSAPATDRARALRKDIPTLETGITAVRQAYDGGPVRPRCRLLRFLFGGVGLGLQLHSFP